MATPTRITLTRDPREARASIVVDGKSVVLSRSVKGAPKPSPSEPRVAIAIYLAWTTEDRCFGYGTHRHELLRFEDWNGNSGTPEAWARQIHKMVLARRWCDEERLLGRGAGAFRLRADVQVVADESFRSWFNTASRPEPGRTRMMDLVTRVTAPWRDPRALREEDLATVPGERRSRVAESNALLARAWEIRRSKSGPRGSEPILREAIRLATGRPSASGTPLIRVADALLQIVRLSSRPFTVETALVIALVTEIAVTLRNQFQFQADWRVSKPLLEELFEQPRPSSGPFASWATERAALVAAGSAAYARHVDELLELDGADSVDRLARGLDELTAATPAREDAPAAIVSTVAVVAAAAADQLAFKRAMGELRRISEAKPDDDYYLVVAAVCGHDREKALKELDRWRVARRGTTHLDPYWSEMVAMATKNPTITFVDLCSQLENQHSATRAVHSPESPPHAGGAARRRRRSSG